MEEEKSSLLAQKRGFLFLVCVFIAFMQAGLFAGHVSHEDENGDGSWIRSLGSLKTGPTEHPIPKLMADAETNYRALLAKQSKTLKAAVAEYTTRYGREPPRGFGDWWAFAKKYEHVMVDEYDGLVKDLAPFWGMSGEELRRRAEQVAHLASIDLVRIRDGKSTPMNLKEGDSTAASARANGFNSMLGKFVTSLPDLDFPINAKAEGRILVPWEHRKYPNITLQDSSRGIQAMLGGEFKADWQGSGGVWEAYRRTCAPASPARRLFSSLRNSFTNQISHYLSPSHTPSSPGADFNFVQGTDDQFNFCSKPYAHYTQGHFFSDWRTIPVLYPVFSPAKSAGFLDVRIPSHYYYGSTQRYTYGWDPINLELKTVDKMEVPWEDKIDRVFWRGATTGGGSQPPGFSAQYQRHRFLRMTSERGLSSNCTITYADPPASSNFVSTSVPIGKLNDDIMDVAFVKATDAVNYPGGLAALRNDHRFGDAVPLGRHWAYKYLVDLDGMSYSGRFMGFMASDSAAMKATVYQEYFSDWIQPWLHYIPLSSSYKEIYNIHAFFSGPSSSTLATTNSTSSWKGHSEGDRRLRRIARAGKHWKQTVGRTLDMEIYVYRLALEYARLCADDRESMRFTL